MYPSRTFSLAINLPWAELYAFLSDPRTINQWTQGVLTNPLRRVTDYEWQTIYDGAQVAILFTPPNDFGVLDVELRWADKSARHYLVRLFANDAGSELCCTVLQRPEESDAQFASECEWLRTDLNILKAFAESL